MKYFLSFVGIAVLVVIFACVAGCATTTSVPGAPATTAVPGAATTSSVPGTGSPAPVSPSTATKTAAPVVTTAVYGIDTTVSVHYNDFACLNIPKALGVDYLYPGEKYTIRVTSPGSGTITPNLIVLDVTDYSKLQTSKPTWDSVQKTWVYSGVVPLRKLIDIASPQSTTLTVEDQGYYYICIDDRKETGTSDAVYQVPVKVSKS
ncbi:MAG: hypothetical protein ABFC78_00480 [Methanoregula sp.]